MTVLIFPSAGEEGSTCWVARLGLPVGARYASTKGAMETLTRAWSADFGTLGIRVNAVSPGVIRTPEATWDRLGRRIRPGDPGGN